MKNFSDLDKRKQILKDFVYQNKPEAISKLDEFKKEIVSLNEMGYSSDQILNFLNSQDVDVPKIALDFFIQIQNSPKKIQEILNF